jgi:hypothetical protein
MANPKIINGYGNKIQSAHPTKKCKKFNVDRDSIWNAFVNCFNNLK